MSPTSTMSDDTAAETPESKADRLRRTTVARVEKYINFTDATDAMRRIPGKPINRKPAAAMSPEEYSRIMSVIWDKQTFSDDFMRSFVYCCVVLDSGDGKMSKVVIRGSRTDVRNACLEKAGIKRDEACAGPVRAASDDLVRRVLESVAEALRETDPEEVRKRLGMIALQDKARVDGEKINEARIELRRLLMGRGIGLSAEEIVQIWEECASRIVLNS